MRRIGLLACVVLLASVSWAQFTTVTGTVVDPNGLPYAFGTISASLVISGSPKFTSTNQPYTPPSQPVGLSSNGSFIMQLADNTQLTPGGSTWTFTVSCAAGCVPVAGGKGPVSFTVTGITISGASQSITATLTAAALPLSNSAGGGLVPGGSSLPSVPCTANALFNLQGTGSNTDTLYRCVQTGGALGYWQQIKPTIETVYAKDYGVTANARYVNDATTTNTSKTVTCPNSDCNFVNATQPAGDVGKAVWVKTAVSNNTFVITQDTIATVNSAQSITVTSNAATSGLTGTAALFWGSDDSLGLDRAWVAANQNCSALQLPSGMMFLQQPEFNYVPGSACFNLASFQEPTISGASSTGTLLTPMPSFAPANSTHGCSPACFLGAENTIFMFVRFEGFGTNPTNTAAMSGQIIWENNGALWFEDLLDGWCSGCANSVGYFAAGAETAWILGGVEGVGQIACQLSVTTELDNTPCNNGANGSNIVQSTGQVQSRLGNWGSPVTVNAGGIISSYDETGNAAGNFICAGTCNLYDWQPSVLAPPSATTGSGKINAENSSFPSSTATLYSGLGYQGSASGQLIDHGGNTFGGLAAPDYPTYYNAGTTHANGSGTTLGGFGYNGTAVGDILVVQCQATPNTATVNAPTDTLANSWTQIGGNISTTSVNAASYNVATYYTINTSSGTDSFTCNFAASATTSIANAYAWHCNPTCALDGSATNSGNGTSVASSAVATSQSADNSVLLAIRNTGATFSIGTCTPNACNALTTTFAGAEGNLVPTIATPSMPGTWSVASDWAGYWFNIKQSFVTPVVIGTASATGTAITAAKLVLSGGWGTTAAWTNLSGYNNFSGTITASGSGQAANPTVTYTFPNPYYVPPQYCTLTQNGGTQAVGTFSAASLTKTGVVFTYSGTPGAGNTLIVHGECYGQ